MDESTLTKGQLRKLNALKKSVGDDIGTKAFSKWLNTLPKKDAIKVDPVAAKLQAALSGLVSDASVRLGNKGYSIKRAKGKGASDFVISKIS